MTLSAVLFVLALFLLFVGFIGVWPLVPCLGAALVLCIIAVLLGRGRPL